MMNKTITKMFSVLSIIGLSTMAVADDTDIIDFEYSGGSNILFVMDMSGSMEWELTSENIPANPADSRKNVLHSALQTVLNDPTLTDINIGISYFSGEDSSGNSNANANGIAYPISHIDSDAQTRLNLNPSFTHKGTSYLPAASVGVPPVSLTTRGYVSNSIPSTWIPKDGTPIVDALHEAALYFRGLAVDWGNFDPSDMRSAHPSTYTGIFGDAANPPIYTSPIMQECSNNAIVLLSDGRPTANSAATAVRGLVGGSCDSGTDAGRCGNELTAFLANTDNVGISGDQFVKTHTIGVALDNSTDGIAAKKYLKDLATSGKGEFVNAITPDGLASALKNTITLVSKARSFTSPTYTPNLSSLLSHSNDVYLPVFDRGTGPVWPGNLKKFKRENGQLIDADGLDALNLDGSLKDTARDFWSASLSTHAVKSGGAAHQVNPSARAVTTGTAAGRAYTDNGSALIPLSSAPFTEFDVTTDAEKDTLVNYILGNKSDGTSRNHMGDIIHSKPVHLAYGTSPEHKVIFVGTNEGYLHAINDENGSEVFAFMPEILLKNIKPQYENNASRQHIYGVDGPITVKHNDLDSNGIVNGLEKAYIYFGLRRGGKAYYKIDVTKRTEPKLIWKIDNSDADFSNLGFTWSQPVSAKMNFDGTTAKPVLIFGGGYFDDTPLSSEVDGVSIGAQVYIVDDSDTPTAGQLVWKTSLSSPPTAANKYAVPAAIRVLDISQNGSLDRLYFGDTGGNIWRADFDVTYTKATAATTSKVIHFADLGGVNPPATAPRMFFVEPDVALFKHDGKYLISVAIGSGERPDPLGFNGDDHFFVLFDKNPLESYVSATSIIPSIITKTTLVNATTAAPISNALTGTNNGWYTDLVEIKGEKVLARALTYNNMVIFSTLGATTVTITACGIQSDNYSRLYVLDLITGAAVLDLSKNGVISKTAADDKSRVTDSGKILGPPQILFNELATHAGSSCVKGDCIRKESVATGGMGGAGSEEISLPTARSIRKAYWLDKE